MPRLILGLIAAALGLPLLFLFGENGVFWFAMTATFTVPLTALAAAPLVYLSRKRITFLRCILAGLAIGLLGVLLFGLMSNALAMRNWAPLLIVSGMVSSVVFWIIGVWKNDWFDDSRTPAPAAAEPSSPKP